MEWVQPVYPNQILLNVNDPSVGNQWYLDTVKAKKAWDISKGDTNVVIGISDTGFDIFHEDLKDQIKYNWTDPINGEDDDNDGYIDNFRGWDFKNNDNNPDHDVSDIKHGTIVAGIAGGKPNNSKGIAGLGYNCKLLPVKSYISSAGIIKDYESMVYLADHGAKVINSSWGGYTFQPLGQDIIDYITYNRDALIVCAAGNLSVPYYIYPASYVNAFSVAGTNTKNMFWVPNKVGGNGSGYGFKIDVAAPAVSMYSTNGGNSYISGQAGTSFAAPIVSGIAGLIRSKYHHYSAQQTAELIRITADNIDTIAENAPYRKLMGKGQVNAYRALIDSVTPSIRLVDYEIKGLHGNIVRGGDTAILRGSFVNYLHPTRNVIVSITDYNGYLASVNKGSIIDTLGTMDTVKNFEVMFIMKKNIPYDASVALLLNYANTDGYSDWQFVTLQANPSYLPISSGDISSTVTATGSIGYTYVSGREGNGFNYKNKPLLYSSLPTIGGKTIYSGLILAKDTGKILLNYGSTSDYSIDSYPEYENTDSSVSIVSSYNAKYLTGIDFNFKINQKVTAWPGDSSFLIYEYDIINTSFSKIDSMYSGLMMDWGVSNQFVNKAVVNVKEKCGYVYSIEPESPFVGIKVLRGDQVNHHLIEMTDTTGEIVKTNDFDGMSKLDIFNSMIFPKPKLNLTNVIADDIVQMISVKSKDIAKGDTLKIAFALFAASDEQNISSVTSRAELRFKQMNKISLEANLTAQLLDNLTISPSIVLKPYVNVQFNSIKKGIGIIKLIDGSGKTLNQEKINIIEGENTFVVSGLNHSGLFVISIECEGSVIYDKCIRE